MPTYDGVKGWIAEDHERPRALLVVDVQNDFCEGGALAVTGGNKVAVDIANMLTPDLGGRPRHRYDHVAATLDWHVAPGAHFNDEPNYRTTWPHHCVAGTVGAELNPALEAVGIGTKFRKGRFTAAYSGFEGRWLGQDLDSWLGRRGIKEIDVVGLALDYCVLATALDAQKLGYETAVLLPFTAAVNPDNANAVIDQLQTAGVRIWPRVSALTSPNTTEG